MPRARLLQNNAKIWVRVFIIPGINNTIDEMRKIKAFYVENGKPLKTELLPYHQMDENKHAALYRVLLNPCET